MKWKNVSLVYTCDLYIYGGFKWELFMYGWHFERILFNGWEKEVSFV